MTGVLGDIVRDSLTSEADMQIIGDVAAAAAGPAADRDEPTVVVWRQAGPIPVDVLNDLLYRHPRLRVLTVEGDGRHGRLHELVPRSSPLGELSPALLVAAVRGTATVERGADPNPAREAPTVS